MRTPCFILSLVAVVLWWAFVQWTNSDLRAQIELTRQESAERGILLRGRDRLQRLQRERAQGGADKSAALIEPAKAKAFAGKAEVPVMPTLVLGEWLPLANWENRGQATAIATVETALWAAAGGDVNALKNLLQLDEAVRAKAEAVLTGLPAPSRVMYPTAEHLLAAFTTKAIPLGDAQLVWQHHSTEDDAVACVFVKQPDPSAPSGSTGFETDGPQDKVPPMAPPNIKTVAAYLSLHQVDGRWRIVVPETAVDKIAKELAGGRGR